MKPTAKQRIWMYETMLKSRKLDEAVFEAYWEGKKPIFHMGKGPLPGEMHQSFGQEPAAVGVCAHLGADDAVGGNHRPHHTAIARGVNLKRMAAELFGKKTGLSGGRGGHMHLYDKKASFFCSGIIAEGMGPGAGFALAKRMRKQPGIAVSFNGDGAVNQGAFHEVMNMVGLWKLPFIAVIEDNEYAVSCRPSESTAVRAWKRAEAYACRGEYVTGNDPDVIFEAAGRAVEHARSGKGGYILEIQTERLHGHFIGDSAGYRPKEEVAAQKDPIPLYRQRLLDEKVLGAAEMDALEARVKQEVDEAMKFGRDSEYPAPQEALERVFA
jgi:acetoin:2,6-dichlorophenolindophenol oxidoreductase subunit alpha